MKCFYRSFALGIALLLLAGCQQTTMTFQEIFPVNHLTKLEITKGNGEQTIVTDKFKIRSWLTGVKATKFTPRKDQEEEKGYLYFVKMYEGEKEVGSFTTSKIKNYYYERNADFEERIASLLN
ncbi:hypothetical protein [Ectobacillus ponti]|uniref:YxeA family protein n=1 Tax=Ectobacillus ponti TaxID=2961894 RepID=A0AA42BQG4_9BACI|nr:hypothetical protein [Ectobacillus ponti]MCP8968424.1 hypothetical protein [Ectobacillus ponti]